MAPPVDSRTQPAPSPREKPQDKGRLNMDELLHEQLLNEHELFKLNANTRKTPYERRSEGYYRKRLELADELWNTCRETHRAILRLHIAADDDKPYFATDKYSEMEDLYCTLIGYIREQLKAFEVVQDVNSNAPKPTIIHAAEGDLRLPRISIPQFTGGYRAWTTFRDLFSSLVHENKGLSDVQKLHYLKSNVSGEAGQLIKHLTITEHNYAEAWGMLMKRYQNQRALVNAQLQVIFSVPAATTDSASSIKKLLDTTNEGIAGLKTLQVDTTNWDPMLVYLLTRKLHSDTVTHWETFLSRKEQPAEIPTFIEFTQFLELRFRTLDAISFSNAHTSEKSGKLPPRNPPRVIATNATIECPSCNQDHPLRKCNKFILLNPQARREFIRKQSRCFNCLGASHSADRCPNPINCQRCGGRHNTLLHVESAGKNPSKYRSKPPAGSRSTGPRALHGILPSNTQDSAPELPHSSSPTNPSNSGPDVHTHMLERPQRTVLLATALLEVLTPRGNSHVLRALLDQGSQASFITEDAVQRLGLPRQASWTIIRGIGRTDSGRAQGQVQCIIRSRCHPTYQRHIEAFVLPTITGHLPASTLHVSSVRHLQGIQLADPTYLDPGRVDMLLGAEVYADVLRKGLVKGPEGTPIAQQTWLGWILSGRLKEVSPTASQKEVQKGTNVAISLHCEANIDELLKRFWEVESVPEVLPFTPEDKFCEDQFIRSHRRTKDGRYVVSLPFKHPKPSLGESRSAAVRRLIQVERRLTQDAHLAEEYAKFMEEYEALGHMEQVAVKDQSSPMESYYLPHHAVFKADSSTTKVRVVFDASSKSTNGQSLNDQLFTGPALQNDLSTIVLRWRQHRIALTADIEKMYRQILVEDRDCQYQMIVWRKTPTAPIREYRLRTVTYGMSCAPYLALRVLQQLSQDEMERHPHSANLIRRDLYVDDLMTGANTVEEAIRLQRDVYNLLSKGGFHLRKWTCNHEDALQAVPEQDKETLLLRSIEGNAIVKTLGLHWNPSTDTFEYKVREPQASKHTTKREFLSQAARLFDPLGWLAPTVVLAKIMFQQLWLAGVGWDDPLPAPLQERWQRFSQKLPHLENIRISRWTQHDSRGGAQELHGFCDASTHAYAAVVYLRYTDPEGNNHVTMLSAKTKVAPIQQLSIPRLELSAAVLLIRLLKTVTEALGLPKSCWHAWTDSLNVLAWIRGHPRQWKTFVANRVSQIQEHSHIHQWRYVRSSENPADCASRGVMPEELEKHPLWWTGPSWLSNTTSAWPQALPKFVTTDLESKPVVLHTTTNEDVILSLLERVSKWTRLIRVVAMCRRFIDNVRKSKEHRLHGCLTSPELRTATELIVLRVQQASFAEEVKALRLERPVPSNSRLKNLNPFCDKKGILRVGGRLRNSSLSFNERHPIILPSRSSVTRMIIDDIHRTTLHGGVQLTLNLIRKKYWVLDARNTVRHQLRHCITCFRYAAKPETQLMGDLPTARVNATRPFLHTGVDFTGHLTLRESKLRGRPRTTKGYIAVFICLATKAIHLEVVSDLSTDAFLAAFRRFTSRRGMCSDLYSDCGTNFLGASSQLTKVSCLKTWGLSPELQSALSIKGVQWHFIPPASPHFGGLWEAGVKSTKHHLRRIAGESLLTFEEATTLTTQIEACLNSRPLYPLSNDPDDLSALTPGHFLIGDALLTPPEPNFLDQKLSSLRRWHLIQRLYQHFWKRWLSEYLPRLQQRTKWTQAQANVQVGDLLLLKDERIPPARWPLGRVLQVHPGHDGLVRVVTIKCKGGTLQRPISKICVLPKPLDEADTK